MIGLNPGPRARIVKPDFYVYIYIIIFVIINVVIRRCIYNI